MYSAWKHVAAVVLVLGSIPACAVDKALLTQRLRNAAANSSLDDASLKPWHLKISFQLFSEKGAPGEHGTIEEWWSGSQDKRVYTSPSYTSTEVLSGEDVHRSSGQPSPPYLLELLRDQVVHPLARESAIGDSIPDLRSETFGKVKLDCIMLDQPIKNVAFPPMGLFPTYCLDPVLDRLRLSYNFGSENITRNSMGLFQGRSVPIDTSIVNGTTTIAKGHVETLSGFTPPPHFFDTESSLEAQNTPPAKIEAGVMAGSIIKKVSPIYPDIAIQKHISGTVLLRALIGTDGHIHTLRIIDTPDASLAISAVAAVRQWTYRPYLLNGVPTTVDTTITVHYNFGPA